MKYYAKYENGVLTALGTGTVSGGTEITEAEYSELLAEVRVKASLLSRVCSGELDLDGVPAEWRDEIERRAEERLAAEAAAEEEEATADDLAAALEVIL